jgi:hypothetical protein
VSPDLFLHPVFDIAKAGAGVPDPKIIHPVPQNGIDQGYHPTHVFRVGRGEVYDIAEEPPKDGFSPLKPTFLTLKSPL